MARDLQNQPPQLPQLPQLQLNGKLILTGILALIAVVGIFSSFYTIGAESEGVVQRFGRFKEIVGPGLRFKIPFFVDKVSIVPVKRQLKLEFGFGSYNATDSLQASKEQAQESDMVTGDLNAAKVEWVVQYEVSDSRDFLFNLREPGETLRALSESVMREVVGDRTVDEVLTIGRQGIENDALVKLGALMEKLQMGLRVQQVQLKNVHPPGGVQRSFDEVNRAQQEREQMINQANGEYNKVVPRAKGEAEQKLSEAQGYAVQRVNEAEGDVARFKALLAEYEKAPAVTRQRLYLETMTQIIPQMGGKIILDDSAKQFLPLMNLQAPQSPQPAPAPVRK